LCAKDEAAINAAGGSSGVMGLISTLSGSTHGNTGRRTVRCGVSLGCCMIAGQIPASVVSCALTLSRVQQGLRVSVRPTVAWHPQQTFWKVCISLCSLLSLLITTAAAGGSAAQHSALPSTSVPNSPVKRSPAQSSPVFSEGNELDEAQDHQDEHDSDEGDFDD
jgi:hypothetical protein